LRCSKKDCDKDAHWRSMKNPSRTYCMNHVPKKGKFIRIDEEEMRKQTTLTEDYKIPPAY